MVVKKGVTGEEGDNDSGSSGGGEGGSDGGVTGAAGGKGGSGWVPSYYELLGITEDEQKLTELAAQALFEQRISVKSQGYDVTALSKVQQLRNQMQDPGIGNDNDGGGSLGLEDHPELAELGGDVDPNIIVLPESELLAAGASNDPKLQNKLRQRLAAKFGMGSDLSMQSMKAEYEKKMRMRGPAPKAEPRPRYRPTNAPKNRPY